MFCGQLALVALVTLLIPYTHVCASLHTEEANALSLEDGALIEADANTLRVGAAHGVHQSIKRAGNMEKLAAHKNRLDQKDAARDYAYEMPCDFRGEALAAEFLAPEASSSSGFLEVQEATTLGGFFWSKSKQELKREERIRRRRETLEANIAQEEAEKKAGTAAYCKNIAKPAQNVIVSLSGGGARSAMTGLVFLEFLADIGMLPQVSTVAGLSGGSWGGTIFCKWGVQRQPYANRKDVNFADEDHGIGKIIAQMKSFGREFGETKCFNPAKAAVGTQRTYFAWVADVANAVFFNDHDLVHGELSDVQKLCHDNQNINLQVFVNAESPPSSRERLPDKKQVLIFAQNGMTKWTAGVVAANEWFDKLDEVAFSPEHSSSVAQYRKLKLMDLLALSSSAWAISPKLAITGSTPSTTRNSDNTNYKNIVFKDVQSHTEYVYYGAHDPGIDCNIPLNPEWGLVEGGLIVMVDASDGTTVESKTIGGLDQCLAYWKDTHNLDVSIHSVWNDEDHEPLTRLPEASWNDASVLELRVEGWKAVMLWVFVVDDQGSVEHIKNTAPTMKKLLWPNAFDEAAVRNYLGPFKKYLAEAFLYKMAAGKSPATERFRGFATQMCDAGIEAGVEAVLQ